MKSSPQKLEMPVQLTSNFDLSFVYKVTDDLVYFEDQ